MNNTTCFWHDYETFGTDPSLDRAVQFAGIRTDEDLNIIDQPVVIYAKPANDFLPQPEACLITGITPQKALQEGLNEAQFISRIQTELASPATCSVGYNSLRFDDEFTRFTLYRNFFDPYAREWQNGNTRWDIIDMVRLTKALRPDGISWPLHEDGSPSFKLEDLSRANNIAHETAHDALSDVYATIAVARLIKQHQPRLYDYIFELRFKHKILELLNLQKKQPVVHVSGMYPGKYGYFSIVVPLAMDPGNKNGIIVYDLRHDPDRLISASAEEIQHFTFTAKSSLGDHEQRFALKTVHINKCPVVVPLKTLTEQNIIDWEIDLATCNIHLQKLIQDKTLASRIQTAFSRKYEQPDNDPDQQLYSGGFFSPADRERMELVRQTNCANLSRLELNFKDKRLDEMLFRYRCRNFPETLSADELIRWDNFRKHRMTSAQGDSSIKLDEYRQQISQLEQSGLPPEQLAILQSLKEYPRLIGLE